MIVIENDIHHDDRGFFYESFVQKKFDEIVGKEITFVEIGILDGGSLFMWRDFFGNKARIIGVDLNPEAKKWEKEGFEIFIGIWHLYKIKVFFYLGIDPALFDAVKIYL